MKLKSKLGLALRSEDWTPIEAAGTVFDGVDESRRGGFSVRPSSRDSRRWSKSNPSPYPPCSYCDGQLRRFGHYGERRIRRYQCVSCGKTQTTGRKPEGMRISQAAYIEVVMLLAASVGINEIARRTGLHKNTIRRCRAKSAAVLSALKTAEG